MARCLNCGKSSPLISKALGVCIDCIRNDWSKVRKHVEAVHEKTREAFGLQDRVPKVQNGVKCSICVNECQIPEGEKGYCGVRANVNGKLKDIGKGFLDWYYDSLPTNCVGSWICPGGSKSGYPKYSYSEGPEYGYKNLAVFYRTCSFNCLFCQNWHFREGLGREISASDIASKADARTSCICYFGGDPTPQIKHAIETSQIALENKRILRICWETNGSVNPTYLKQMAKLSLNSGGCIKFDLKAWNEAVNLALCGVTNKRTLENFTYLADFIRERPDPPFLIASTPLVPGYVDLEEVRGIAHFIASLNPDIPYSLLAFYPHFVMNDLPTTCKNHAYSALEIAKEEGLNKVHIGNLHLLSNLDYMRINQ
jgi:pyruvate formate lyase activating enzyme